MNPEELQELLDLSVEVISETESSLGPYLDNEHGIGKWGQREVIIAVLENNDIWEGSEEAQDALCRLKYEVYSVDQQEDLVKILLDQYEL